MHRVRRANPETQELVKLPRGLVFGMTREGADAADVRSLVRRTASFSRTPRSDIIHQKRFGAVHCDVLELFLCPEVGVQAANEIR